MSERRQGDTGTQTYYRTDRFYSEEGGWFAKLREGEELGPFDTKGEARQALADFIELFKSENPE